MMVDTIKWRENVAKATRTLLKQNATALINNLKLEVWHVKISY